VLVQESLGQIGVRVSLNKIPGANWRAEFTKKTLPFIVNAFGGWLNFPEYFFYWAYHGQNAIFNTMSYQNPEMDKLIEAARFESDRRNIRTRSKALFGSPSPTCPSSDSPHVSSSSPHRAKAETAGCGHVGEGDPNKAFDLV